MQDEPKSTLPPSQANQAAPDGAIPNISVQAPAPLAPKPRNSLLWTALLLALFVIAGILIWALSKPAAAPAHDLALDSSQKSNAANSPRQPAAGQQSTAASQASPGISLNLSKAYGDKYANGLLPVGDGKYATGAAKVGYIYACSSYAQNISTGLGGASNRGPWFTNNNTEYDLNKKVHVSGSVSWQGDFADTVNGSSRLITTNDLPDHTTGVFPIASSDPAYAYDRNPNTITSQSLSFSLPANPVYSSTPHCMGGEAGIMLTGVVLFNGFDAGGRDAGAWEVQDACAGHPQSSGEYHYHTLSGCIKDTSVSTVVGFALDGFPITGPAVGPHNILSTADLDECHGLVSSINLNGKAITTYHYVMTQDFPYSVSCFRGTPVQTAPPSAAQPNQTGQQGGRLPPKR